MKKNIKQGGKFRMFQVINDSIPNNARKIDKHQIMTRKFDDLEWLILTIVKIWL